VTANSQDNGRVGDADRAGVPTGLSPQAVSIEAAHPSRGFLLKPYVVSVPGYGAFAYPAASRGKALAEAWRDYRICSDTSFGDFLRIARATLSDRAPRFGEPIEVAGKSAFYVGERGQYIRFARPGETITHLSHPADVSAVGDAQ
jgi:hypothetical protein